MSWLTEYSDAAKQTDQFAKTPKHTELLAAGLFGEVGSVLAELKKEERETDAYPAYRNKLVEEIGDTLWYMVRIFSILSPSSLALLNTTAMSGTYHTGPILKNGFTLGTAAGNVLSAVQRGDDDAAAKELLVIWDTLVNIGAGIKMDLQEAASRNLHKVRSRWPENRDFIPLFDDEFIKEEQLPRTLDIEFRQIDRGGRKIVLLRCNGLNFGDRLTDNIEHPDFYRYHDIFHFSYAVYLGWSPVIRKLLNCKRKSDPNVDENQDGARARIIDEAISAIVFARAKELQFYDGIDHVDYDLLKTIQEFVRGFEVDKVPLWQWEAAILQGYSVFRSLRCHGGGKVTLDILKRDLRYQEST